MSKAKLRQEALSKRKLLTRRDVLHSSRRIIEQLELMNWQDIKTVHIFLPIEERQEIDLRAFLAWIWGEHPAVKTWIPEYERNEGRLYHQQITKDSTFFKSDFGQLFAASERGDQIEIMQFDRIIVPCLMTDSQNARLGYGLGIYDTFLASQHASEKIGVNYAFLHCDRLPTDSHDEFLSCILLG